ncbi:unnamed protein product [Penicillium bialowiezense]
MPNLFPVAIDEKQVVEEEDRCKRSNLGRDIALARKEALESTEEPFLRVTFIHGNITGTTTTTAAEALNDTSFFFSQYAQEDPFGNFHIALRIGLSIIENGALSTKGGAHVLLQEYLLFHDRLIMGGTQRSPTLIEH